MTKREMLRNLIKATNGLFFSIDFVTKKGEPRHLTMKNVLRLGNTTVGTRIIL